MGAFHPGTLGTKACISTPGMRTATYDCSEDRCVRTLGLQLKELMPPWSRSVLCDSRVPPWEKEAAWQEGTPSTWGGEPGSDWQTEHPSNREGEPHWAAPTWEKAANAPSLGPRQASRLPDPMKMENPPAPRKRSSLLKVDEGLVQRRRRAFPQVGDEQETQPLLSAHTAQCPQPTRAWPDEPSRISAASYSAVEIHGFFGLIDDGSDASGRTLIVHIPKWIRGYFMDFRQGDTLHVNRVDGKMGGVLTVLSTGRHKYYAPGRRVSTCTICVPEEEWAPFTEIVI